MSSYGIYRNDLHIPCSLLLPRGAMKSVMKCYKRKHLKSRRLLRHSNCGRTRHMHDQHRKEAGRSVGDRNRQAAEGD